MRLSERFLHSGVLMSGTVLNESLLLLRVILMRLQGFTVRHAFCLFVSGLVCWNDSVRVLYTPGVWSIMSPVPPLVDVCNYMIFIDVH